jgi:predicted nucleic acid-binding protein
LIVLDASAVLEWLLRSATGVRIEARILASTATLHAPHLLDVEISQVLRRGVLRGGLAPGRAQQALEALRDLPLTRHAHTFLLPRVWNLRHNLSAYDATYVALAEALAAPLFTCDRKISQTPKLYVQVEVF